MSKDLMIRQTYQMPAELQREVDAAATNKGISNSEFARRALREKLDREK